MSEKARSSQIQDNGTPLDEALDILRQAIADRATLSQLAEKLSDAPLDNRVYGRRNGLWFLAEGGGGGSGALNIIAVDDDFTVDTSHLGAVLLVIEDGVTVTLPRSSVLGEGFQLEIINKDKGFTTTVMPGAGDRFREGWGSLEFSDAVALAVPPVAAGLEWLEWGTVTFTALVLEEPDNLEIEQVWEGTPPESTLFWPMNVSIKQEWE